MMPGEYIDFTIEKPKAREPRFRFMLRTDFSRFNELPKDMFYIIGKFLGGDIFNLCATSKAYQALVQDEFFPWKLNGVLKSLENDLHLFQDELSSKPKEEQQIKKYIEEIRKRQEFLRTLLMPQNWVRLPSLSKAHLASPYVMRQMIKLELPPKQALINSKMNWDLEPSQITALMAGITKEQLRYINRDSKELYDYARSYQIKAMFFEHINYEIIRDLSKKQVHAVLLGYNRSDVKDLNDWQLDGLVLFNLTRAQVKTHNFSQSHVEALKEGIPIEMIVDLNFLQVEGIRIKLTREQVLHENFSELHLKAIKELGFSYDDVIPYSSNSKSILSLVVTRTRITHWSRQEEEYDERINRTSSDLAEFINRWRDCLDLLETGGSRERKENKEGKERKEHKEMKEGRDDVVVDGEPAAGAILEMETSTAGPMLSQFTLATGAANAAAAAQHAEPRVLNLGWGYGTGLGGP